MRAHDLAPASDNEERRQTLARSYQGDVAALVRDMTRQELVELFRDWSFDIDGVELTLPAPGRFRRDDLEAFALRAYAGLRVEIPEDFVPVSDEDKDEDEHEERRASIVKPARVGDRHSSQGAPAWEAHRRWKLRDVPVPFTPHDHQLAAWDRMTAHFVNADRQSGIVVLPTGGGKTVVAAHWLLKHHLRNGARVLWLAHRTSLLRQAVATFHRYGNLAHPRTALTVATVSSSDASWSSIAPEHDAVFSSIQTAALDGNMAFVRQYVDEARGGVIVVMDEAHHAAAPSYARLLRALKKWGCKLLGLTATPVRTNDDDQRRLVALFDQAIVYQVTRRELTERGILAAPAFETVKTEVNFEKDFTPDDYRHLARYGELGPRVVARLAKHAHRNTLIVDHYVQKKDKYGPTIVFAADTLHAHTLADELKKRGVDADYVDHHRRDAHDVIERYREKRTLDVLVNVEMLTEGFDAPHTRTVFIARPTRSEGLLAQMVGRALRGRLSGGNAVAHLVTFLDTWEQFDVLDAEYVLRDGVDAIEEPEVAPGTKPILIPVELVREAYRLLQSNVRGQLTGVFQCLPHSWYAWNEEFEDDHQRRSVMVFDNQVDGYAALLAAHAAGGVTSAEITEEVARALVEKFFVDAPDPLPRWADVKALLDARQKGCSIEHYTFDEKSEFDPRAPAQPPGDGDGALRVAMSDWGPFPFGKPNTERPARHAARPDAVVIGVYPGAWHVRWTAPAPPVRAGAGGHRAPLARRHLGREVWTTLLLLRALDARPPAPSFDALAGTYGARGSLALGDRRGRLVAARPPGLLGRPGAWTPVRTAWAARGGG